ncbi:MAG: hypothetical protein ACD_5C00342G0003 [uncultured bacterium]|nr:MAG: hypothetical protein ACD_5C00342G0003 [uncultured bacterium]
MPKIQINAKGIRAALKKYNPYQSLCEYVWNGFDAQASEIKINYTADGLGNIEQITISDNGYGIPHGKLQEKFEPVFESKKALENKLKKNQSAIHGKNGIGRLTFFTFARNASWTTVYENNGLNYSYEIYTNAENINLYTGLNSTPRATQSQCGTTVTFSGIHGLIAAQLEEKFREFLLKEFAWFLALNTDRNFSITLNDKPIEYQEFVADQEELDLIHEKSQTSFRIRYIRWNQKFNNEPSRYYYLSSEHKERWKEPTAIKNRGEQFYHSVFIESPYFDSFSFQSAEAEKQDALILGTRSDSQFRFLRKKLATILRIKRRPFLKVFAEQMLLEFEEKNIISVDATENFKKTLTTLYEMQPRIFSSLGTEQRKMLTGLLDSLIKSDQRESLPILLSGIIDLTEEEQAELKKIISE